MTKVGRKIFLKKLWFWLLEVKKKKIFKKQEKSENAIFTTSEKLREVLESLVKSEYCLFN